LRERNRERVIGVLRTQGRTSQADIARATGLSRTTVSSLGDPMTTVATLVWLYGSTGNPFLVAGAYIVKAVATIIISAAAGALPDRVRRAPLIINLELGRASLLFLTPFLLNVTVWTIFPILFVLAAVNAIVEPARQAALPELVEPREVGPANAGISAAGMIAGAGGYALAGLVIWATLSAFWLFLADGLTFLLAGILVFGLGNLGGGVKRVGIWSGIGRTWSVVRARSHLLVAGAAAFFISMSFPTLITLAYSLNGGKEGARTYVILEVMLATGIVFGSIIVGRMRNIGSMRTVAQGLVLTGVLSVGIAMSPYWLVAILLLFASAGNPVYAVANVTVLMEISDGSNRGTIMSSRFAITQLALIAGAATGALISKLVGPSATYGVLGAGLIGLGLVAAILSRERTQIVPATE